MNVSTFASSKLCEAVYNTLYPTTVPYVRLLTHLDVNISYDMTFSKYILSDLLKC